MIDTRVPLHSSHAPQALELWGGLECTVARIQDSFRNQIRETGHYGRIEDLETIAALGIRTLRYPVVWETVAPDHPDRMDWRWHDERLARLRELGIAPIAGLVHHGSGPRYTSLVDPAFPALVARHAAEVAKRYPWIALYTPVNEPLTTARFSGLYGHWYPHGTSTGVFLRALVNQCLAVVLSMRAIRRVNPAAKLVQTEDLGKVFSRPGLQYQADYENERRWLSFDLLCGRVDGHHPWYGIFLHHGIAAGELEAIREAACAPDILGINHYLTSERYLDERIALYPDHAPASNGREDYVDVEAVRIDFPPGTTGPEARLRETWERYRLPIAVTEAHHGCTRDEQLRWLMEVWNAAARLRGEGADLRAVTVWSMFGAVDWNSLLVQRKDFYEPGPFDVRSTPPRPTVLAKAARSLAEDGRFDHPVLDRAGWWKRDERLYQHVRRNTALHVVGAPRRILITGATGTLGRAIAIVCGQRGLDCNLVGRREMDIANPRSVAAALAAYQPWAIINTAGYVRVPDAERERERCFRENASGAGILAEACAALGIPLVTFSSDLVFDGRLGRAYRESDAPCPTTVYGESKARAEELVLQAFPAALVARTSAFFGPWDIYNFAFAILRDLAAGREVQASERHTVSPTYVPDLAHAVLDLLIDGASGIWHLANRGSMTWHGFARELARQGGFNPDLLRPSSVGAPADNTLDSERGKVMPTLEHGVDRFFHDTRESWRTAAADLRAAEG